MGTDILSRWETLKIVQQLKQTWKECEGLQRGYTLGYSPSDIQFCAFTLPG